MSLLTDTQGTPERVWSVLSALANLGEQPRPELERLLNPGVKPHLELVKPVNIRQVLGAATSIGGIDGDRTTAASGLTASVLTQTQMADWMHDMLCGLEADDKNAVIFETYAWLAARSDKSGSMAWMHEMNAGTFASAAAEGLLGLDDDGDVKMNSSKVVAWRRWLNFLGLAVVLPSPMQAQPSPAARLQRELVRAGVAGQTLPAQAFIGLIAERMPYLDRGRLYRQACERLGHPPSSTQLSPLLSVALRDLHDEGVIEMTQVGDAAGIIRLTEDPTHPTNGFLSVHVTAETAA